MVSSNWGRICSFWYICPMVINYCFYSAAGGDQLPPSLRPAVCPLCNKVFSRSCSMKLHLKNVHADVPEDQWETCYVCGKKRKTRHLLVAHLAQTHGIYQTKTHNSNYPKPPIDYSQITPNDQSAV